MLQSTEILTMSSREIADLTEKRHDAVLRDIRKMLSDLDVDHHKFVGTYTDAAGRDQPCFSLPRREVEILLTGYSVPLRARVVDRLRELEQQESTHPKAIATDSPLEFARLILETMPNLGDSTKQVMLSKASEIAFGVPLLPLPKVDEHLMNATEVGKLLGISAQAVGRLANANGLKTAAHGEVRLDKSKHSSKMVENFFYNKAGVEALRDVLGGRA